MRRRTFLQSAALGATALGTAGFAAGKTDKPNILFIFADDLCYETIRAFNYVDIDTPNLDKLVKRGTVFTHAYNMGSWTGAVCVASRTMLNTGRFLWNAHSLDDKQALTKEMEAGRLWAQQMKRAGYRTYMTGKWHVKVPAEKVFDVTADVRGGMPKQTPEGYNRPKSKEDYEKGWKPWETKYGGYWEGGKHWSEVVGDHAEEFLAQASKDDNPFFMYIAFNAAHDPRQSPKRYVDRYPLDRIPLPKNFLPEYPYDDEIGCGPKLRDARLMPFPRTPYAVKVNRQEYYAIITHMDDQIGRIFEALKKSGKEKDTYIIFTADQGLAVGHHGLVGKQNMYDHSVRVPLILAGPNIPAGQKIDTPVYLQDIMPSTLELAGIPKPKYVDFHSLLPLLHGGKGYYDAIYGAYTGLQRMVTKNGWKLIYYPTIKVDLLYNLIEDPLEMNNLAKNPEYAGKLKELHAELDALCKKLGDPLDFNDPKESWEAYLGKKKKKGKKKRKK